MKLITTIFDKGINLNLCYKTTSIMIRKRTLSQMQVLRHHVVCNYSWQKCLLGKRLHIPEIRYSLLQKTNRTLNAIK